MQRSLKQEEQLTPQETQVGGGKGEGAQERKLGDRKPKGRHEGEASSWLLCKVERQTSCPPPNAAVSPPPRPGRQRWHEDRGTENLGAWPALPHTGTEATIHNTAGGPPLYRACRLSSPLRKKDSKHRPC